VSGLHHVELRPRSLRYYTTERPQRLCRKQTQRRHSRAKYPVLSAACPLYPQKRHCSVKLGCPPWANRRHMQCSKWHHYSITSSAMASTFASTSLSDGDGNCSVQSSPKRTLLRVDRFHFFIRHN
jgi:hypothetical protein